MLPQVGDHWINKKDKTIFEITDVRQKLVFAKWAKGTTTYSWKWADFEKRFELYKRKGYIK